MPFTFQYNKTSLHHLGKQLKMRLAALPVLKNKESALRIEVAMHRAAWIKLQEEFEHIDLQRQSMLPLLGNFPMGLLDMQKAEVSHRKIAGVKIPQFESFSLPLREVLWHEMPHTHADVLQFLQRFAEAAIRVQIAERQVAILERERKRTTQKVNLYEKVQIPQMEEALKKIKRFLEDEQNLAKSAQKMVKARKQNA